ncbi:EPIDERMAL PATTERNING FACTOR-like protein 5 [Abrus precatorius]|uniref:Epidermal patterning factor-like protein n=1 Tax=Abrus precatorius TaxID=3816 RepID=A0A8B8MIN1_ABRPR|nr:EPIDERMAL PATTERNING FACTOR-like protein 5 [Abrus precatorius]
MGVIRHHRRREQHYQYHWLPTFTTFTFLLFSSTSAIAALTSQPSGGAVKHLHREEKENGLAAAPLDRAVADQKRFGGPGSSPPSCRSKCGWCSPCQPVHVPVQPGLIIRLEYYPEAWRCKCGNKLFMP